MIPEVDDMYGRDEGEYGFVEDFDRLSVAEGEQGDQVSRLYLARGTLVNLRSSSATPLLGVFLGVSSSGRYAFYTSQASFYVTDSRSVDFQVPGYFTEEELQPLMPFIDTAAEQVQQSKILKPVNVDMPLALAIPIIRKMRSFRRETEMYHRKYSEGIDSAFQKIAHPTEVSFRTLEDVISVVTGLPVPRDGEYPWAMQFAISNALLKEKFGFMYEQRLYSEQKILTVLAKHNLDSVYRVQSWLRAYWEQKSRQSAGLPSPSVVSEGASVVSEFVKKCQILIAENRRLRRLTGDHLDVLSCNRGEHSAQEWAPQSVVWSDTDRDFIKALHLHACANALHRRQAFRWIPPSIVRATGCYEALDNLHLGTNWNLLLEIGCAQPFTDPEPFDLFVRPASVSLSMSLSKISDRLMAGQPLLEAGQLRDAMSEVRKDWGNMPVFCIDKTTTVEVDDGVSLEPISDEPGHYWYHIHISHLSAYITPESPIGQCAEHRLATVYSPAAGTMRMLPPWVGRDFSLSPNKPCLTFSAKLNSEGDVLDRKIQAGFIRNVVRLSPRSVDKAFGMAEEHQRRPIFSLSVGTAPNVEKDEFKDQFEDVDVNDEQMATLKIMHDLMSKYKAKRNPVNYTFKDSSMNIEISNMKAWPFGASTPDTWKPEFCLVDPKITIDVYEYQGDQEKAQEKNLPSSSIVEEAMILAGSIGAHFARERNIPVVYNGLRPAVDGLENATERMRDLISRGQMNSILWRQAVNLLATAILSSEPVEHRFTGLPEYARVTSPLRRHFDLVNMWQIDAALREEHRLRKENLLTTGSQHLATQPDMLIQTASTNATAPFLPYTRPQLDRLIRLCVTRSMTQKWFSKTNYWHWKLLALARAHYLNEAPLPKTFAVEIGPQASSKAFKSWMVDLEVGCLVAGMPGVEDGRMPAQDEVWEVKIEQVTISPRNLYVVPVRRVSGNALDYRRKRNAEADMAWLKVSGLSGDVESVDTEKTVVLD